MTQDSTPKKPVRTRGSRLRPSHCKNCKADTPDPIYVLGIGEMCLDCAPPYLTTIGPLIEIIDGHSCQTNETLFRAMVRALQQLNMEYRISGNGQERRIEVGTARYRPSQMLEVYGLHRYQYEALIREQRMMQTRNRNQEQRGQSSEIQHEPG